MAWILLRSGHQIARISIKIVKTCSFWHPSPSEHFTPTRHREASPTKVASISLRTVEQQLFCTSKWCTCEHRLVMISKRPYGLRTEDDIHLHMQVSPGYNPWTLLFYDKDSVASNLDLIVMSAGGGSRVPRDFQTGNFCWPSIGKR